MNRAFKGVWIPAEIWILPKNIMNWSEKIFYVEIDSLNNDEGCFASNDYFAEFFDVSKNRCSQIISSLVKKGYITREYEYEGNEIKKRILRVVKKFTTHEEINGGVLRKCKEGTKKMQRGYLENAKDNNTINNTINIAEEDLTPPNGDVHLLEKKKDLDSKQPQEQKNEISQKKTVEEPQSLADLFSKFQSEKKDEPKEEKKKKYFDSLEWGEVIDLYNNLYFDKYGTEMSNWTANVKSLRELSQMCLSKANELRFYRVTQPDLLRRLFCAAKNSRFYSDNGIPITPNIVKKEFNRLYQIVLKEIKDSCLLGGYK